MKQTSDTGQNISYAVMARRVEASDSFDYFPTPAWATRALVEHGIQGKADLKSMIVLEPACGQGHMSKPLEEYFKHVVSSDINAEEYGYGIQADFLSLDLADNEVDWMITNPPFNLAEEFILKGLRIAERGVAVLVRTSFIEGMGRYTRLFKNTPPTRMAQFVERVPMIKGKVSRKASTATAYAWLIWEKGYPTSQMFWIPPCRKSLERDDDYTPEPVENVTPSAHVTEIDEPDSSSE